MNDDATLVTALRYARQGWAVLPIWGVTDGRCACPSQESCASTGKHPITTNGVNDATTDEARIRGWFRAHPTANVAIATGADSGLVVLDVDPRNGGDESLDALVAENGELPDTAEVATGGGGRHFYFAHPGGSIKTRGGFVPGLDVKSDGGYVVAPPSTHQSGGGYGGDLSAPLAPLPESLQEWTGGSAKGQKALREEIASLGDTTEGGRNNQLNVAAFNLGQLVDDGSLSEALVVNHLRATGYGIGLTEREIENTIRSGFEGAKSKTRRRSGKPKKGRALTDLGNAERLVAKHGDDIRYCFAWSSWLVWDEQRFVQDETGAIIRRAKETVREIYAEALAANSDEARQSLAKHAGRSESERAIKAMISLARSESTVPVSPSELDSDPWLLNVPNGTIDLRAGRLRNHRKRDLITKLAPVEFIEEAECPTWLAFLDRVMDGNAELVRFLKRAVGYSLTGDITERAMFLLHGSGRNGKSTFINTIESLLGDYSKQTPAETLLVKRNGGVPSDVARLVGARFVAAVETEEGKRLAQARVKALTGGDTIATRFMYEEWFEFRPEFKIWLATNHLPQINETDKAMWDRIRIVPFTVRIPEAEQDPKLPERLAAEMPGILMWALDGLREWRSAGLGEPPEVRAATDAHRVDLDVLGDFIEEQCETGVLPTERQPAQALYDDYRFWCKRNGEEPRTNKQFSRALVERGFERKRNKAGFAYFGVRLRDRRTRP